MDEIQLRYQRLLDFEEEMLLYMNYKVIYGIFGDKELSQLLHKRTVIVQACCYTHAWDIALDIIGNNEEILELKSYGDLIPASETQS